MNTQTDGWEAEFDEKFNKPLSDQAHQHLISPTSGKVYYDNTDLKDFIRTTLSADRAALAREVEAKKLVNTKDETSSDWFYGFGFNAGVDAVLEIIRNKK